MAKDYNIPAKPTKYNGRLYRSRLEARFAAFFDICNFKFEYEPFDLKGWSPDFILYAKDESNLNALVEIKPIDEMFDIRKYINVDFEKYSVWLMTPDVCVILSKNSVESIRFPLVDPFKDHWIESANVVMFLKP